MANTIQKFGTRYWIRFTLETNNLSSRLASASLCLEIRTRDASNIGFIWEIYYPVI